MTPVFTVGLGERTVSGAIGGLPTIYAHLLLMSAELELAAWNLAGEKLWTTFVEPPWDYQVRGDRLELDVMGKKSSFDLHAGPGRL